MAAVIYLMALAVWIFVACVMWCAAGLIYFVPRVRPMAWPMSLATAATFPFVFAYQLMVTPAILMMMLVAFALWGILDPVSTVTNPAVAGGFVIATVASAIVMLAASVAGFADGWRTGWGLARGRPISEMFSQTLPKIYFNRLVSRLSR